MYDRECAERTANDFSWKNVLFAKSEDELALEPGVARQNATSHAQLVVKIGRDSFGARNAAQYEVGFRGASLIRTAHSVCVSLTRTPNTSCILLDQLDL